MKPIHLYQVSYMPEAVNTIFSQLTGRVTEYGLHCLVPISILVSLSAGITMPSYFLIDLNQDNHSIIRACSLHYFQQQSVIGINYYANE